MCVRKSLTGYVIGGKRLRRRLREVEVLDFLMGCDLGNICAKAEQEIYKWKLKTSTIFKFKGIYVKRGKKLTSRITKQVEKVEKMFRLKKKL
jgi:hypothetical protein